ncbi:hypothetical protein NIES4073_02160 (plasmid) [Kalymmatonema gypsitolerans NIES-4073]|nr:hypothetical protein NIES4073_02160 [Scytonema sp. NIES-4073]
MKMDFVNTSLPTQKFAGKSLSIGATLPTNPGDKDLWFEPSYAPQPWEYDVTNNVWRSQPVTADIAIPSNGSGAALQISKPFPIGTTTIWLENYTVMLSSRSGVSNAANDYLSFQLQWINNTGTATTLDSGNSQNLAQGQYRRIGGNLYQYITNPNQILLVVTRVGSTSQTYQASLSLTYKFVRPNA